MVLPANYGKRIIQIQKKGEDLHVSHQCMLKKTSRDLSCECVHEAILQWIEVTDERYEDVLLFHEQPILDPLATNIRR